MVAVLLKWDTVFCQSKKSLVTKSKLTMLITHEPSESKRRVAEAGNTILFGKHADREDGRLMSQNSSLVAVWISGPFMDPRWGKVRKLSKKAI